MYIRNHGVDQDLIDEVFDISRKYHAQPLETKMKEYAYQSPTLRGFEPTYTNTPDGRKSQSIESTS